MRNLMKTGIKRFKTTEGTSVRESACESDQESACKSGTDIFLLEGFEKSLSAILISRSTAVEEMCQKF